MVNVRRRRAGFASKFVLYLARALSVSEKLQLHLTLPLRVYAEGRGDSYRLEPNNCAGNLARNRRV
ncbi:type VI secretion system protein TssL, partial [Erwinia amylovora]|nr:type VI secretion system protein TssL [Erwinia amylovora]